MLLLLCALFIAAVEVDVEDVEQGVVQPELNSS